jgi:hypothetical protein
MHLDDIVVEFPDQHYVASEPFWCAGLVVAADLVDQDPEQQNIVGLFHLPFMLT